MAEYEVFEAGDLALQSGATLPDAKLAYRTHGTLNAARDNVVVFPTRVGGTHVDNDYLIGPGRALDPERYFIVVPNMLGNGLSSSPSNTPPPFDRMRFPAISHMDNVALQHRLLTRRFGIERIALAVGFSMGGQQAYHWAALHPRMVERLAPICTLARSAPHTIVFLEGLKVTIKTDAAWRGGDYDVQPERGLRALGRVWAGWGLSQAFFREHRYRAMGFESLDDFLDRFWETRFLGRDANDMLAMFATWQRSDVAANALYDFDLARALGAIRARALVMPGWTDLYFPPEDNEDEARMIPNGKFRVIRSIFGHQAGGGANPDDVDFIDEGLKDLLEDRV